jgi:serine/threonine protein kinase
MGSVYLAENTRRGGRVALKLLAPELARDERFRRRFLRETEVAASLDDPHVVPTLALVLGAAVGASLTVGLAAAEAGPGNVICSDEAFTDTAKNVIVPSEHGCDLLGATVTHNVILENDSGACR